MKKVSRRDLIILALVLTAFLVVAIPQIFFQAKGGKGEWGSKASGVYYCPMHPTYVSDRPGDCPICYMKLVPKPEAVPKKERKILYYRHPMGQPAASPVPKKDEMGMDYIPVYEEEMTGVPSQVPGHAAVQIPPGRQQLMGVKLGPVEKRKLAKEIRTVGRVAFDPELFTAQQEFLSAWNSLRKASGGPYHEPLARAQALLESVRVRLRLLGMTDTEIGELVRQARKDQNLILPHEGSPRPMSPAGQFVWVYGMIYEYEIPFVKVGTRVEVRVPTFADRAFQGEVRGLDPVLDSTTRALRVRAKVMDPERLLKPEMYVDLFLVADLGETVSVPQEAVMFTGERAIVFVAQGEGFFEPREVKLGTQAGNFYEVKTGLHLGEQIAVSGNFLIDSESRLQSALEGMTSGGHTHG